MPIFVCGINHKTAPLDLREKVIFATDKIPLYLADLANNENIREAVLLSTCNRSEFYCEAESGEKVMDWFCAQHPVPAQELHSYLYFYQDQKAVEHIMQVACGLDSMVVGETQILGQLKTAFSESCAAGSVGTLFNRLFQQVFFVAKEIRNATAIGACPVSIASAAVNFIKENFSGNLTNATCLLIGAGDTTRLTLRHLRAHSFNKIIIANRHLENANVLAKEFYAEAVSLTKLPLALKAADIVITSTGSTLPIVTKAMLTACNRPLFIVDIAVPRDVEAAASELASVRLFTIDDLKSSIQKNLQGREHAAQKAREMIHQKVEEFILFLNSHDAVATTIRAYRKQIEDLCHAELAKSMRKLQRGEDAVQVLAGFAYALTNKLLHAPSVQLRQASVEGRFEIVELAKQLLAIPLPESELL